MWPGPLICCPMDDFVDRLICSSRSDGSSHSGYTSGGAGRSSLQFGVDDLHLEQ